MPHAIAYKGVSVPLRGKGSVERTSLTSQRSLSGILVSVPLRGKGSVELAPEKLDWWIPDAVSVPLRGKGSVEPETPTAPSEQQQLEVSVPLRGKGSVERRFVWR